MDKESFIKGFVDLLSAVMEKELGTQPEQEKEQSDKSEKKFIEAPEDVKMHHFRVTFETDAESNLDEEKEILIDDPKTTSKLWEIILSDEKIEDIILEEGVVKFLKGLVSDLSPSTKYIMDINLAINVSSALNNNLEVFCVNKPIISRK